MTAAAPLREAVLAQAMMEGRLTLRRGENLLAMVGVPAGLLLLLGSIEGLPGPASAGDAATRSTTLLPGILALAIMATGLVNLGIATAYERTYGVLLRLGLSPLGIEGLVAAKLLAVVLIELLLAAVLVALAAVAFGWRPTSEHALLLLLPAVALGTATFAGLGLALAGALRAEAVLLVANVLFLLGIALGGVVVPHEVLPAPVAAAAGVLPFAALRDVLAVALGGAAVGAGPWLVLGGWSIAAVGLAVRLFRVD